MQYALIVYETPDHMAERESPDTAPAYWGAYTAFSKALVEGGVARGGAGLFPPTVATTVRLRGGQRHVQDGPFADTKELLGGFFLIESDDLEGALAWAARCPSVSRGGSCEVRPTMPPPPL